MATSRFGLGLLVCILSGIFSAMLNFSFIFGGELRERSALLGASTAASASAIWCLALSAGFLANAGYCVYLLNKNRTWPAFRKGRGIPYLTGILLMGLLWFGAILLYGVGAATLGTLGGIVGWPLLMTMTVITANIWGAVTGEWTEASRMTRYNWWGGIAVLLLAIYVTSLGGSA